MPDVKLYVRLSPEDADDSLLLTFLIRARQYIYSIQVGDTTGRKALGAIIEQDFNASLYRRALEALDIGIAYYSSWDKEVLTPDQKIEKALLVEFHRQRDEIKEARRLLKEACATVFNGSY